MGAEPTFPRIDRDQVALSVDSLFYRAEGGYVSARAFLDGANQPFAYENWAMVPVDGGTSPVVDALCLLAYRCAANPQPAVCCPPICTFDNSHKADAANLRNGLVLSVEIDSGPVTAHERLLEVLGPATMVVASGGVWIDPVTGEVEDRLHIHWRLREPTRDPIHHDFLRECRRLAAQLVGGDTSAIPAVHPLRLPGSWHCKSGTPRLCRIACADPEVEIDLAFALERLRQAVEQAGSKTTTSGPRRSSAPQADILDIAAALTVISNDDVTWDEWIRIGLTVYRASGGSEAGYACFVAWSSKSAKHNQKEDTRERWAHFGKYPPDTIGAGTLFHLAKQARSDFIKPSDRARTQDAGGPPPGFDDPPSIGDPVDDDPDTSTSWASPAAPMKWPEHHLEVFHGLAGRIVGLIMQHSEADPIAILVHLLVEVGNAIGRHAYYVVEADRHYPNLFALVVGATSKARKGTAAGRAKQILEIVDPEWAQKCVHTGLSTGEGLIWHVRDETREMVPTGRGSNKQMTEMVTDKRRGQARAGRRGRVRSHDQRHGAPRQHALRSAAGGLGPWRSGDHDQDLVGHRDWRACLDRRPYHARRAARTLHIDRQVERFR
jgi:hypothetical protein